MATIYLIQGSAGEWDSYAEWVVEAFADQQAAIDRAAELNALVDEYKISHLGYYAMYHGKPVSPATYRKRHEEYRERLAKFRREIDPNNYGDCWEYRVVEVPFHE